MLKKVKILLSILIISATTIGIQTLYNKNKTKNTKEIIGTIVEKQTISNNTYNIRIKINDNQQTNLKLDVDNKLLNDLIEGNKYVFVINENGKILKTEK